jgi:hypothetical protein
LKISFQDDMVLFPILLPFTKLMILRQITRIAGFAKGRRSSSARRPAGSALPGLFAIGSCPSHRGTATAKEAEMDNFSFGLTMIIVGMGGTLVALAFLALLMGLLKKLFPLKEESRN